MKNILIPTDFSLKSSYAIYYGAALAEAMNAGVTLLHAYHFPIMTDAAVMQESTLENWEKDNKEELRKIASSLHKKHPALKIETATRMGFAVEEILGLSASHHIDLLVMGSKGMGSFGDDILGNVTSDVVRDSNVPVLVIPPEVTYKALKQIVLACYDERMITPKVEHVISDFVNAFHAAFNILDVRRETAEPVSVSYEETNRMISHFNELKPVVHIIEDEKVVHGINEFAEHNDIDLIAMIPGKHNFFERMFTEIHTRHMAHDTKRPLLVIPNDN
jgi:nucleotide-binding universal stress UspA family protein